jgi:uncharacterized membrane protein YeaQ/YmgE (transglycosylase-associated protein family)
MDLLIASSHNNDDISILVYILNVALMGLIAGALGRLVLPGADPIGLGRTILAGIGGGLIGTLVAAAIGASYLGLFLLSIAGAALIVYLMRGGRRRG